MSARDQIREMMDEMMGAERDVPIDERKNIKRKFDDPEVCKYYLCGLNPYSLFHNTKSYLGPYDRVEDDDCKAQWEALSQAEKDSYGYEYDLMVLLDGMVTSMDRDIARKQDRVRNENQQLELPPDQKAEIAELQIKIDQLLAESEAKGEEGEVDEALALSKEAEALKAKQNAIHEEHLPKDKRSHQQKTLEVCLVCGILMSSVDSEERKRDHKQGKQYQGWTLVRNKLKELKAKNPPPKGARSAGRDGRERDNRDRYPVSDGRDRRDNDRRDRYDDRGRGGYDDRSRSRGGYDRRDRYDDRRDRYDDRRDRYDDRRDRYDRRRDYDRDRRY